MAQGQTSRLGGKYGGLKQHYNEFYRIYGDMTPKTEIHPKVVITEDSNAGYQFFQKVCLDNGIKCVSAGGKTRILHAARNAAAILRERYPGRTIHIIDSLSAHPPATVC